MTNTDIILLLTPILARNPEGIDEHDGVGGNGLFDLDINVRGEGFRLWVDSDEGVPIPLSITMENAKRIQACVRSLGREVMHTWGMQYGIDPEIFPL